LFACAIVGYKAARMAAKTRSKRRSSPLADTLLVLISLIVSVFGA